MQGDEARLLPIPATGAAKPMLHRRRRAALRSIHRCHVLRRNIHRRRHALRSIRRRRRALRRSIRRHRVCCDTASPTRYCGLRSFRRLPRCDAALFVTGRPMQPRQRCYRPPVLRCSLAGIATAHL